MLSKFYYKNLKIKTKNSKLYISGRFGILNLGSSGADLRIIGNVIFIKSKQSFGAFLAICKQIYAGLTFGCFVEVLFSGLGYRFFYIDEFLYLKLGFGHYIKVFVPNEIQIVGFKDRLILFSLNLFILHRFVALLRKFRVVDVYKGKGILIKSERVVLKVGKKR